MVYNYVNNSKYNLPLNIYFKLGEKLLVFFSLLGIFSLPPPPPIFQ